MEDSKIIALYWQRDEKAIAESAGKYGAYCFSVANNILNDFLDSEECVNDTWMRAWNAMPPTKPTSLKLFLAKITRNLALTRYAKSKMEKQENELFSILDELGECKATSCPSAEENYIEKELAEAINKFLGGISQKERCVFVRRYFYAESSAVIAEKYNEKEKNINLINFRTRKKLKEFLEKEGFYI